MARPLDGASRTACDWTAWYRTVIIINYQLTPTINIQSTLLLLCTVRNRESTSICTVYVEYDCNGDYLSHSHQIYLKFCMYSA